MLPYTHNHTRNMLFRRMLVLMRLWWNAGDVFGWDSMQCKRITHVLEQTRVQWILARIGM